ncbi:MAG TPA: PhnD/SsuA/transferrin family substrate-binding protein [Candidatus Ozemobacteraceae bacterium]|nr:PhnD/SsuA/transferrin family substrate-binding protein [Candidatus Ozemobacteraceae bacterium]
MKYFFWLLLWFSLSLSCVQAGDGESTPIQVGFSSTTLSSVDVNDAVVALKVWFEQILSAEGLNWKFETTVYQDPRELDAVVREGRVDVLTVSTMEYLRLASGGALIRPLTSEASGMMQDMQYLLVHVQSPIQSLEQLKGKKIIIDARHAGETPMMWLEVELAKRNLPRAEKFFSSVKRVKEKPSLAILPVFFQQADACLVRQQGLDTVAELNPQVGKNVRILMKSEPFLRGVTGFYKDFAATRIEKIVSSSQKLDKSSKGLQVLTLFKVDNILPMPDGALDSSARLKADYERLVEKRK